MKKLYISTIAAAALASSSMAMDVAGGTLEGDATAYTISQDDASFTTASVGATYTTPDMSGLKGSLGVRANALIAEDNDGVYDDENDDGYAMHTANVSYSSDAIDLVLGRQAIDLEWIGDYHDAAVAVMKYVPNMTIVAGYTKAMMAADYDGALYNETNDIGDDGAMVVDAAYSASEALTVGAYYMSAPDIFSAMGAKVETTMGDLGLTGKYAMTSEDVAGTEDGSILAIDASFGMFGAGYIMTDKDGGSGSITALGDNINPFDNGDTYGADTSAMYASVSTEVSGLSLGVLAGSISMGDATDTEIDVTVGYAPMDNLSIDFLYVNYMADDSADDVDYMSLTASYSF